MDTPPVVPASPPAAAPETDPVPYEYIWSKLKKGKVIPFLGAGASLSARSPDTKGWKPGALFAPSATELAGYLDGRTAYPSGEPIELARVAQYFDGVNGRGGLDDDLHEVFCPNCGSQETRFEPGALHRFLAKLPQLLVVTTNYDDLMEQALRDEKRPYRVVIYRTQSPLFLYWDLDATEPQAVSANDLKFDLAEAPVVFKMHGAVDRRDPQRDSYVITEDDYVEFLARLGTTNAIPVLFAESFRNRHFLFLGYGLRDWNLRVVLHRIYQQWPRRYASWAVQQKANALERAYWAKRSLSIYELSVSDFVRGLAAEAAR